MKVKKLKLAKKRQIKLKKFVEKLQVVLQQDRERENILTANNKMINLNKNANFDKSMKKAQKIAKQNLEDKEDLFKMQRRLSAFGDEGYMRNDLI